MHNEIRGELMKIWKKAAAGFVSCAMLMGSAAVMPQDTALFASAETYQNLTYTVRDNRVSITRCNAMAMSVVVPNEIDGKPVVEIDSIAFENCTILKSVTLPNTIERIGNGAFGGCTSLTQIELPDSLTTIDWYAFSNSGLTSITIPDSVTQFDENVFSDCENLEAVKLGAGITNLPRTFTNCKSLKEVTIPASVTNLSRTFEGCTGLKTVVFEEGSKLEFIEDAFFSCTSLENITLPEGLKEVWGGFVGCTALKTVAIPDSVTVLSDSFASCTSLETVNFGKKSKVTNMSKAFYGCTSLKEITIPKNVNSYEFGTYGHYNILGGCSNLEKVTFLNPYINIPNEADAIPASAVIHCYENSTAHAYALVHNREFVLMPPPPPSVGDINIDGSINASDAAMILTAAAVAATGGDTGLTEEQISLADLNEDGVFNAIDASIVLCYAAYVGAGGTEEIEEWIAANV